MNKQYIPYGEAFSHRLTRPPKALLRARLDNIAIVPASMLPFGKSLKDILEKLPKGAVFLCHAKQNSRQTKILERVGELFQEKGHRVTNFTIEQVV
jgi:hypothetical protein